MFGGPKFSISSKSSVDLFGQIRFVYRFLDDDFSRNQWASCGRWVETRVVDECCFFFMV